MNPLFESQLMQTRRQFFGDLGLRAGGIALGLLAGESARAGAASAGRMQPPSAGLPHFRPRAKALIYLHMNGGPSQLDLWDYKPQLRRHFEEELPDSVRMG